MASGTPPSSSGFDMNALFRAPQNPNSNVSPGANPPSFAPYLYQYPPRSLPLSAPATPSPGGGAHLMALLGGSASLESAASLPPSSSLQYTSSGEFAPPTAIASQRSGSVKQPKGRRLPPGDRAVYDVDSRLPDEPQPSQLEVSPITKYASDPGLVLGQQIAVNRTYICYGLKLGAIRVLNINTALRSLLKGHRQRVTDMAFFAEDVHLLASSSSDGRIFIWKIDEGPDDSEKPQITEKIIIAIQIVTNDQSVHPRVCWHCHKQEILAVGIGNLVLRIDTSKLGKLDNFSAEKPLPCSVEKLIDGVQLIGKHEAEVTDLSMSQWMTTRFVSASKDGTVKIWEDLKAEPLAILRPHDGQPVNSATFVTAPHRPDHIVLITAGPLNRELKIWVSSGGEGWFLAGESVSWHCTQTLELMSSSEIRIEDAFFNQVVVLPQASLILLANAKKNAIYAVHVNYGPNPVSTCMDYVSEFMVTMPILSLTGITECLPDGAQVVQVYCVQTQAIQQYALDLSQCLPPALETTSLENEPYFSSFPEQVILNMPSPVKNSCSNVATEILPGTAFFDSQVSTSAYDLTIWSSAISGVSENYATESGVSNMEYITYTLGSPSLDANVHISPLTVAISQDASKRFNVPEQAQVDTAASNHYSTGYVEQKDELHNSDISSADETASSLQSSHLQVESGTPHLITPSEILSGSITSLENTGFMHEQKVGEAIIQSNAGPDFHGDKFENFGAIAYVSGDLVVEKEKPNVEKLASKVVALNKASLLETDFSVDNVFRTGEIGVIDNLVEPLPAVSTKDFQVLTDDISEKLVDSATVEVLSPAEVEKQKVKMLVPSGSSSFSASPFNSTNSVNDGDLSGFISMDAMLTTLLTMQENINEILVAQKEMQKQLSATVSIPVSKEGRRIEASLGRSMEKAIKGNVDGLWARYQEESAKHEKMERDRFQQLTGLLTNCMTKELPAMFEKTLRKEMSAIGPAVTRAVTPILEKTISSAVTDCFQKSVGEKVVTQLEKSINTKLETMLGRQLQSQLLSSGKIAFQDSLRSVLESSVVPAFEKSCKSLFEQVDVAFQKGMSEHSAASQKQFDSSHTTLGLTLQDAINSVSSITQNLTNELAEGQRKLLTLLSSGKHLPLNSMSMQRGNDAFGALLLPESVDPKTELTRLVSEHKFEEAFTLALQRSDLSIVSWLCLQVDLQGICSMVPLPLSQGVLLALFQQLACDLGKDTSQKLGWMTEVATVINPTDLTVASHVRPIFEQISQILIHQRALPTTSPTQSTSIRLILHVINSVLLSCK